MQQLLHTLLKIPEVEALSAAVERGGCPAAVTGLSPVHRAQVAAALTQAGGRPLVLICDQESEANRLAEDLAVLLEAQPLKLYARELFIKAGTVVSRQWELARIAALYTMTQSVPRVLVATCEGLLQLTSPPERLAGAAMTLAVGRRYDLQTLPMQLTAAGYTRADQVEGVG